MRSGRRGVGACTVGNIAEGRRAHGGMGGVERREEHAGLCEPGGKKGRLTRRWRARKINRRFTMIKLFPTKLMILAMLLTPLPALAQGGGGGGSGGGSAGGGSASGASAGGAAS